MAIADGPGSLSSEQEDWEVERLVQIQEQGLLLVLAALCCREDVTPWRVDLALGLREPSSPP